MQSIKLVQVKIGESPIPGLPKKSISLSECSNFDRNQAVRKGLGRTIHTGQEREGSPGQVIHSRQGFPVAINNSCA